MEAAALGQLGPWGIVSVFFMLVFLGALIPRWTHKERMKDKEELIKKLQIALDKRDEQFDKLIEQNTIAIKALEELKLASRESRPVL